MLGAGAVGLFLAQHGYVAWLSAITAAIVFVIFKLYIHEAACKEKHEALISRLNRLELVQDEIRTRTNDNYGLLNRIAGKVGVDTKG